MKYYAVLADDLPTPALFNTEAAALEWMEWIFGFTGKKHIVEVEFVPAGTVENIKDMLDAVIDSTVDYNGLSYTDGPCIDKEFRDWMKGIRENLKDALKEVE